MKVVRANLLVAELNDVARALGALREALVALGPTAKRERVEVLLEKAEQGVKFAGLLLVDPSLVVECRECEASEQERD